MKENRLFVSTVSNETLKASPPALPHREGAKDDGCSKVSPKGGDLEGASIVSHSWLVNAKRNLVKTECRGTSMLDDYAEVHPRLEPKGSNKSIALKINAAILQQNNLVSYSVGIGFNPVRAIEYSVGYHPTSKTPPTPYPSQWEGKNGEGERPTIALKHYAPLCRPYGAKALCSIISPIQVFRVINYFK